MAVASFGPTATTFLTALPTVSTAIILPTTGTPTIAYVTNTDDFWIYVSLGNSSVSASETTSMPIPPRGQLPLTIGTNTYLAAISLDKPVGVNITVGN